MADCSSDDSSDTSGSDSSDFEVAVEGEIVGSNVEPFQGIQAWRFEPPARNSQPESEASTSTANEDTRGRRELDSDEWCLCGNCQQMVREEENICCQEIDEVKQKNIEAVTVEHLEEPSSCIVSHPGFQAVCLNVWVLQTAWLQYKQQYGNRGYDGPEHLKNRHIAYRQLVRWCWGSLGKEVRVPLPSCAVNCIRAHFPEPNRLEEDMTFTGFQYADE